MSPLRCSSPRSYLASPLLASQTAAPRPSLPRWGYIRLLRFPLRPGTGTKVVSPHSHPIPWNPNPIPAPRIQLPEEGPGRSPRPAPLPRAAGEAAAEGMMHSSSHCGNSIPKHGPRVVILPPPPTYTGEGKSYPRYRSLGANVLIQVEKRYPSAYGTGTVILLLYVHRCVIIDTTNRHFPSR